MFEAHEYNSDHLNTMITTAAGELMFKRDAESGRETSVYIAPVKHLKAEPIIEGIIPLVGKSYAKNPLFVEYLLNLPVEHRQKYNCDCCFNFIRRYGSMCIIDKDLKVQSLLWNDASKDPKFAASFGVMKELVEQSKIGYGYTSDQTQFGVFDDGLHTHINVVLKLKKFPNGEQDKGEMISKTIQDHGLVTRTFVQYRDEKYDQAIEKALHLFDNHKEVKTRQKLKATLNNFVELFNIWKSKEFNSTQRSNFIWEVVTNQLPNIINLKNGVIGAFIQDLTEADESYAIHSFLTNTRPENYLRPTEAPSEQLIEQAKKKFIEEGLFDSLPQRFATPEDIKDYTWVPKQTEESIIADTPFDSLISKEDKKTSEDNIDVTDGGQLTWNVFKRDVLPKADAIELILNDARNRVCKNYEMISQMVNPDAKPIFRYDQIDNRKTTCTFSFVHPVDRHTYNLPEKVDLIGIRKSEVRDHEYFVFVSEKTKLEINTPLFPQVILSELHSYRSVIEQYCRQNMIRTNEQTIVLGYAPIGAFIIVKTGKFKTKYFINGFE